MNEFFSALAKRWSNAARSRGATIDDPTLDAGATAAYVREVREALERDAPSS